MALKLHLRANERVVINGAVLTAIKPTSILIHNNVSLFLERQIMRPENVTSPARRIYYTVQCVYIADLHERERFLANFEHVIGEYEAATVLKPVRDMLTQIREQVTAEKYYEALKSCNALIEHEDWLLGLNLTPLSPLPAAEAVTTVGNAEGSDKN